MRTHTTTERIEQLMRELGAAVRSEGQIYFTGGVSAVLLGWRETTIDVDLKAEPEPVGFFECLPRLKDALNVNIELASPDLFVPALPGWQDRSRFIARHGQVSSSTMISTGRRWPRSDAIIRATGTTWRAC